MLGRRIHVSYEEEGTLSRRMLGRRRIHLSYEEEEDTCMHACMYFVAQDAGKEEDTFVI